MTSVLRVNGVRSSAPRSGPAYARYGGLTTAYELDLASGRRLFVDGGTGLYRSDGHDAPVDGIFLFTHFHWDHVLGFPFFPPLYDPASRFTFCGRAPEGLTLREAVFGLMRPPWFPVDLRAVPAEISFHELDEPELELEDVTVRWHHGHHPQGVVAYRLARGGRAVAIVTDHERGIDEIDRRLEDLARGADVLIHDAQYHPEEYAARHVGWGHSTWEGAAEAARRAEVGRLVVTAHDPRRTDDEVDEIVARTRDRFAATDAAYEGMVIEL